MEEKTMTNKKNWLRMLIIVLAFGMTVVGCNKNSTDENKNNNLIANSKSSNKIDLSLNGTWVMDDIGYRNDRTYIFNNGNFEQFKYGKPWSKGTYTTNEFVITFKTTYYTNDLDENDKKLYTRNELEKVLRAEIIKRGINKTESEFKWEMDATFNEHKEYYSLTIDGNILKLGNFLTGRRKN
jgi:hypothetical protein